MSTRRKKTELFASCRPPTFSFLESSSIMIITASRPCQRCVTLGREDICYDVDHKKRGRPRLQRPRTTTTTFESRPITPLKFSSFSMTTRSDISRPQAARQSIITVRNKERKKGQESGYYFFFFCSNRLATTLFFFFFLKRRSCPWKCAAPESLTRYKHC